MGVLNRVGHGARRTWNTFVGLFWSAAGVIALATVPAMTKLVGLLSLGYGICCLYLAFAPRAHLEGQPPPVRQQTSRSAPTLYSPGSGTLPGMSDAERGLDPASKPSAEPAPVPAATTVPPAVVISTESGSRICPACRNDVRTRAAFCGSFGLSVA
ncbi:MAG: hypothetical protein GY798_03865 [Hyphomicrobiales bacterium]|nr:hypothetical protein [Hyphomicrobiales bacterium]